jgi:hypothetical protein
MGGNTVTLKTHYDPEQWIVAYLVEMDIYNLCFYVFSLYLYLYLIWVDMLATMPPLLFSLPKTSLPQMEKIVSRVSRSIGGWLLGWALDQQMDNPVFVSVKNAIFYLLFILF